MGEVKAVPAIAKKQPTLHEFIRLCTEGDISQIPQAQVWGLDLLREADFQDRWRVAKVFSRLGKQAIAPLLEIAENSKLDTELRWFAIRILGQYEDAEAIARLILLLDTCNDNFLADEILQALVQLGETATNYLIPLLQQDETRLLAVKALCKIRYPNIVEPLLEVVQDPDPLVRALTIETLSSFRHYRIFAVLLEALADPASQVRIEAVIGLGFWATYAEKDILLEKVQPLLYDVNLEVCRQAALTLSRLQTPAAAKAIAQVLHSPQTPQLLQIQLIQALGWMDVPESLDHLGIALNKGNDPIIMAILKTMGRITEAHRKVQGTEMLLEFWYNNSSHKAVDVRKAFAYALGQLEDKRAYALLSAFSHDQDNGVQLHAIAALRKIINS